MNIKQKATQTLNDFKIHDDDRISLTLEAIKNNTSASQLINELREYMPFEDIYTFAHLALVYIADYTNDDPVPSELTDYLDGDEGVLSVYTTDLLTWLAGDINRLAHVETLNITDAIMSTQQRMFEMALDTVIKHLK